MLLLLPVNNAVLPSALSGTLLGCATIASCKQAVLPSALSGTLLGCATIAPVNNAVLPSALSGTLLGCATIAPCKQRCAAQCSFRYSARLYYCSL